MGAAIMMWRLDGKTCKREFEITPIVLARISMYKNQARTAQEKENEASDMEKMVVVCLKLKQMFKLAVRSVCLLAASVAAFVAG
ncbi:hypothetical protein CFP56_040622 [Quercus suber]|uniref:Uncharacterized protein n=1 Tax=Quercus suber TaxID=58331 RepID=A0AAW0IXN0_QUESU